MAKKTNAIQKPANGEVPETLEDHSFWGLRLDDEQKAFRNAIWDKNKLIVFCDANAGTGKTTLATATAELLVRYGLYDGITYIVSPIQEGKQGFLPGTIEQKSEPYYSPFYQALNRIKVNTKTCMVDDILNMKNGDGYISCQTHTFLRGTNYMNQVVILDEAQNFNVFELKKVLTRIHDNCKVIVIGHSGQIDIDDTDLSGFSRYIEHFGEDDRVAICKLTKNYRGWISSWADQIKI